MIWLFTSFYPESNPQRKVEIRQCLDANIDQESIDRVALLLEQTDLPMQHEKIYSRPIDERPNYGDFFRWANEVCCDGDLAIICNSDICFEDGVRIFEGVVTENTCVALTRWDVGPDGKPRLFHRNDTQDAWLFRVPIRDVKDDFPIGVPRCDNRMLHELRNTGYEVLNPALSVRSYHLHAGDREDYVQENLTKFVPPPYEYLWPHNLKSLPATIVHNLLHPSEKLRWQLDWPRMRQALPFRVLSKLRQFLLPSSGASDASRGH